MPIPLIATLGSSTKRALSESSASWSLEECRTCARLGRVEGAYNVPTFSQPAVLQMVLAYLVVIRRIAQRSELLHLPDQSIRPP
jgi:hypothetical protein